MGFNLPPNLSEKKIECEEKRILVVLGANGSGKTRFGVWLEKNNPQKVHRISAQKSLTIPNFVSTASIEKAVSEFIFGYHYENNKTSIEQKFNNRWGRNPDTFLLNDFEKMLVLLHTEEYEKSVNFKDAAKEKEITPPETKLDLIQKIWEELLPHRKLKKSAGKIEVFPIGKESELYNSADMSDGERLVFYFIGEVLCSPSESLIIIDEPENHLHKSIVKKLWDKIENLRKDCNIVYITHDIDFALSRINSNFIWLKSYQGKNLWDYEFVDNLNDIPKDIFLEILGSRKEILFIEGKQDSLDYNIYNHIFDDFTVVPLGSCSKVIEATKSFNDLYNFHNLKALGIIDRDRKDEIEIEGYKRKKIFVPEVAEIENLFIAEEVVKMIAKMQRKNQDGVFSKVLENIFKELEYNIEKQSFEYAVYKSKEIIRNILQEKENVKNFDVFVVETKKGINDYNFDVLYNEINADFKKIIENKNYKELIKKFNFKGIIGASKVSELCGFKNTKEYIAFINEVLKENSDENKSLKEILKKYIKIE